MLTPRFPILSGAKEGAQKLDACHARPWWRPSKSGRNCLRDSSMQARRNDLYELWHDMIDVSSGNLT